MSTDSRSIKIAFAMSVIAKVGEFLNMLTMQYELRYKWWINVVVMILSVPHCLCWSFYFQNIITFLFEKLSCAVEILIWSDAVDFLIKLLGMPYSVVTAQRACSTEMVKKRNQRKIVLMSCEFKLHRIIIYIFIWMTPYLRVLPLPDIFGHADDHIDDI